MKDFVSAFEANRETYRLIAEKEEEIRRLEEVRKECVEKDFISVISYHINDAMSCGNFESRNCVEFDYNKEDTEIINKVLDVMREKKFVVKDVFVKDISFYFNRISFTFSWKNGE